ncbi:MAG TPA: cupredoxin domain-containing protein [Candidatus Limnocylindrales bacterium]
MTHRRRTDRPHPTGRARISRRARLAIFAGVALFTSAAAIGLVATRLLPASPSDMTAVQIRASMGGFDPMTLQVKAGSRVRIEFASTDTSFHSDGGGWHEYAIDALGIDWKVGPESSEVFEFTAPATPGTYAWYCDICCGGKENPSMQGTLTVAA